MRKSITAAPGWRRVTSLACEECGGEFVTDPHRRYVVVDADSLDWVLTCGECSDATRFCLHLEDGELMLHVTAFPPAANVGEEESE